MKTIMLKLLAYFSFCLWLTTIGAHSLKGYQSDQNFDSLEGYRSSDNLTSRPGGNGDTDGGTSFQESPHFLGGTLTFSDAYKDIDKQRFFILGGAGNPEFDDMVLVVAPEIEIEGNGVAIAHGDNFPRSVDGTNFGLVKIAGSFLEQTFTIKNTGAAALNLMGTPLVKVGQGADNDFTITKQPDASIASGGSTTFTVRFDPSVEGHRIVGLEIASNDSDESVYKFAVEGFGVATGSILNPGDVAITTLNSDSPDNFSFVPLVDIESGTKIVFTDRGWDLGPDVFASTTSGEGFITWTATDPVSAGTEILMSNVSTGTLAVSTGSVSNLNFRMSVGATGDQILVFQGNEFSPSFIYGFDILGELKDPIGISGSKATELPDGLTLGENMFVPSTHKDNWQFKLTASLKDTREKLLPEFMKEANYNTDNSTKYNNGAFAGTGFTFEVTPDNSIAVFSNLNGAPSYTEGTTGVILDSDVTIVDAELDALNGNQGDYHGATLTIQRNGGANADDDFGFSDGNGIMLSGSNLQKSGATIASFTESGGKLTVAFTNTNGQLPTSADVDFILQQISYRNTNITTDASVVLSWVFNDGIADTQGTNQLTVTLVDNPSPQINSIALAADNAYVDVVFSEAVYNTNADSGPLEAGDFALALTGGDATNPVISGITATDGSALAGGETAYRINFTFTGVANGQESITVDLNENAVFDGLGAVAATAQANNTQNLKDQKAPGLLAVVRLNTGIAVIFDEPVQTNGAAPADFSLSDCRNQTFTVTQQANGTAGDHTIMLTVDNLSLLSNQFTVTYNKSTSQIADLSGNALPTDATGISSTPNFDVSGATYDGSTNDFATGVAFPGDLVFSSDGSRMYVLSIPLRRLTIFTLSTAFDPTTATKLGESVLNTFVNTTRSIAFSPDGTKLFLAGSTGSNFALVRELSLSTPFDPNTATDTGKFLDTNTHAKLATDMNFSSDGHKLLLTDNANEVNQYHLTVPFDISSAAFEADLNIGDKEFGAAYNDNGTKLFVEYSDTNNAAFKREYVLTTPFDIRSAIDLGQAEALEVTHVIQAFNKTGDKLFHVDFTTGNVLQYTVPDQVMPALASATKDSNTQVTLSFSEKVFISTANPGDFAVKDGLGNVYAVTALDDGTAGDEKVTLTVADLSAATTDLSVSYTNNNNAVTDFNCNHAANASSGGEINIADPKLLSAKKEDNTTITLSFTEIIQTNAGNPGDFTVADGIGNLFAVSNQTDGTASDNQLVLTVADLSKAVGDLKITYTNNHNEIFGLANDQLATDGTGVIIDLDKVAPGITDARIVGNNRVVVSFNEPVQVTGTGATDFKLSGCGGKAYTIGGIEDGTPNDQHLLLTVTDLSTANDNLLLTYANMLNSITDFGGNVLASDMNGQALQAQFDVSKATHSGDAEQLDLSSVTNNPIDFTFNTEGSKLFVLDNNNKKVYQFSLGTSFDVSTANVAGANDIDISAVIETGIGLNFNNEGTRLFILDNHDQKIEEYALGTAFEISTATLSAGEELNTSGQHSGANAFSFNDDGTKLFVIASSPNDEILEYTLSTAFDISTATYSGDTEKLDLSAQTNNPIAMSFDPSGYRLAVQTLGGSKIVQYYLGTAFDVSTGVYAGASAGLDISSFFQPGFGGPNPYKFRFNGDGSKMYLLIFGGKTIEEFAIGDQLAPSLLSAVKDSETQITLTFNEVVSIAAAHPADFTVKDGAGTTYAVNQLSDGTSDDDKLTLTVADLSKALGDLMITYINDHNAVVDALCNPLATDATGVTIDLDDTVPTIVAGVKDNDFQITLEFSEAINLKHNNPKGMTIVSGSGQSFKVTEIIDTNPTDQFLTFKFRGREGQGLGTLTFNYSSTVITDFGDNQLADPTEFTISTDNSAPEMVSARLSGQNQVEVTFNEAVKLFMHDPIERGQKRPYVKYTQASDFRLTDAIGNQFSPSFLEMKAVVLNRDASGQIPAIFDENIRSITLVFTDLSNAIGDLTVTHENTQNDVTDFSGNHLHTNAVGVKTPGISVNDLITDKDNPEISGFIANGTAQPVITIEGQEYNATAVNGQWSLTVAGPVANGVYDVVATATAGGFTTTDNTTNELSINQAPTVLSLKLEQAYPSEAKRITYRVKFDQKVTNVSLEDFKVVAVEGYASALKNHVVMAGDQEALVALDVVGSTANGGTIRLEFSEAHDIQNELGLKLSNTVQGDEHQVTFAYEETENLSFIWGPSDIPAISPIQLTSGSVGLLIPGVSKVFGETTRLRLSMVFDQMLTPLSFNNTDQVDLNYKATLYIGDEEKFDPRVLGGSIEVDILALEGSIQVHAKRQIAGDKIVLDLQGISFSTMTTTLTQVGPVNTFALVFRLNLASAGILAALKSVMPHDYPLPFAAGTGIESDPLQVQDIAHLQSLKYFPKDFSKLTSDIDATATAQWHGGMGFSPIDEVNIQLDGNNRLVRNLTINRPLEDKVAFIRKVNASAKVLNIGLVNSSINGKGQVAGLVSENAGKVDQVAFTGAVSASGDLAGGLVANNQGELTNARTDAVVKGTRQVAGLVGENTGTIGNSYAISTVTGTSETGGLVATGNGTLTSSYWDSELTGLNASAQGSPKTTAELKDQTTFVGWDFATIWAISSTFNNGYPILSLLDQRPEARDLKITGSDDIGSELTATYTFFDIDKEPESGTTFQWFRSDDASGTNKTAIANEVGKTYTLVNADEGKYISLEVVPRTAKRAGSAVESNRMLIDNIAPNAPILTKIIDDDGANDPGLNTSDPTLSFQGTAEALSNVEVFLGANSIGTAQTDATGAWVLDHTGTSLPDALYSVTAKATDASGNTSTASDAANLKVDTTSPTVTIASSAKPTSGAFTATFTFSEAVAGFTVADLSVSNATASNFVATSSTVYSATINPASEGVVTVDVASDAATDVAGNGNTAATQLSVTNDETAPTLSITSNATDLQSGAFTATFTFSEAVTGFTVDDLTLSNATTGNFQSSSSVYTATITPAADGAVTIDVAANVATDAAGNGNTAAMQLSVTNDESAPTLTITSNASDSQMGAFMATFTFSEAVTGFTADDLTLGNATASDFQSTSTSVYTAKITPAADGAVTVDIAANVATDVAGNGNTAATQLRVTNDETAPTLNITSDATDPQSGAFTATFTFTEAVTSFTVDDITVSNGTAGNFQSTSTAVYTAAITPSSDGAVTIDVAANTATDAAGNVNTAATQLRVTNDETAPTVTVTSDANNPQSGAFTATFTFSEAVTGFVLDDLTVDNGAAGNFTSISTSVYTAIITPSSDGAVTINVAANVATDAAGNGNTAATQLSVTNDETAPTVTVTSNANDPQSGAFTATFTYLEAVTGFTVDDITVGNGAPSNFTSISTSVYTAIITPTADGAVTVDVVANTATDAAGNGNTAATQLSVTNDETAPTVTITSNATDPQRGAFTATFSFSEAVTGFTVDDITVSNGTAGNFSSTSTSVYTAVITPTADGAVTVDVAANIATDAAGNGNTAATQLRVTNDETAPTVTITSNANDPQSGAFTTTFTFSESVTGFTVDDIAVGNGTAGNFSSTNTSVYTATITPAADGAVTVDVAVNTATDAAGNGNTAATQLSVNNDETAPMAVSITRLDDNPVPTGTDELSFELRFSEEVTGLNASDLQVDLTGTAVASLGIITPVNTSTFQVSLTGVGGEGTIGLNTKTGGDLTDLAGNGLPVPFTGEKYTTNYLPTDLSLSPASISENNEAGAAIGTFTTTDLDAGTTFTYALVSGNGDDDNAIFSISNDQLFTTVVFDFETRSTYSIRVKTTDELGGSFEKTLNIGVDNVPEGDILLSGNMTFDVTALGLTRSKELSITNRGDKGVVVIVVDTPGGFTVSPGSVLVEAGATETIMVHFRPTEDRSYSGSLYAEYEDRRTSIELSGEGAIITSLDNGQWSEALVKVYPNPADHVLSIDLGQLSVHSPSIFLLDGLGRPVFSRAGVSEELIEVDISNYKEGLYLLQVTDGQQRISQKVMIKK